MDAKNMRKKFLVLSLIIISISFILLPNSFLKKGFVALAQQAASVRSTFVTKVGSPTGPAPITTTPGGPIGDASCPIPGGKIGCGSYGKPEAWGGFTGVCSVDSTGNGGHCNQNYINVVGICQKPIENGNLIRTAKSIDVAAPGSKAGDLVYLPTISGETIKWKYTNIVDAGFGFGWIKVFQSVGASQGVWTLHLIHVNSVGPIGLGDIADSGKAAATLIDQPWPHVHISLGLNIQEPITANDLQKYDPNWKFPDRELGMCTK